MPLTQNAPREPGCSGFGAILVTLPSSMVRNEPHSAEHSQQVLGMISFAGRFEGRTFIAISSCDPEAIRVQCKRKRGIGAAARGQLVPLACYMLRLSRGLTQKATHEQSALPPCHTRRLWRQPAPAHRLVYRAQPRPTPAIGRGAAA